MRGATSESDHFVVRTKLREKINKARAISGNKVPKFNIHKLKAEEVQVAFEQKLAERIGEEDDEENEQGGVEQLWHKIRNSLVNTAEEVLGTTNKNSKDTWWDHECEKAITKRNDAKKALLQRTTRTKTEKYQSLRREAKKICRKKKREALNTQLRELEQSNQARESRKFYKILKETKNEFHPRISLCKDKQGKWLTEEEKVLRRWKEHFSDILNQNTATGRHQLRTPYHMAQPLVEAPTSQEVKDSINDMKNNKAPGMDNLAAELFKYGGEK